MEYLDVNILRGHNKIGENLIEVFDGITKILLECGISINPTEETKKIEIEVLNKYYDAILITHYHCDHSGLLKEKLNTKHIYMGEDTYRVLNYCKAIHEENKNKIKFMKTEEIFYINSISIKPYLCDHSAYDSYMLEISKQNETILYTGDFRSNGRKSFLSLLNKLPQNIDLLITEHTNQCYKNETEQQLEKAAVNIMKNYKRVFLLQSTLNIDRLVSFYRASKLVNKKFIMNKASSEISSFYLHIPSPIKFNDCYTYLEDNYETNEYKKIKAKFKTKLLSRKMIAGEEEYVMQINSRMINYLKKLDNIKSLKNSVLIYSMWYGYKDDMKDFLDEIRNIGIDIVDLHVSGHADVSTINMLIKWVKPKKILIVHSEINNIK